VLCFILKKVINIFYHIFEIITFTFCRSFGPYDIEKTYKNALHGNELNLAYLWKFDELLGETDKN